ncbi:MAG: hypothetical protein HY904_15070, partial [Deltaproteobacteria bacterium]|nr:hypothetical protein [Deltaproteobacteria bacterium]
MTFSAGTLAGLVVIAALLAVVRAHSPEQFGTLADVSCLLLAGGMWVVTAHARRPGAEDPLWALTLGLLLGSALDVLADIHAVGAPAGSDAAGALRLCARVLQAVAWLTVPAVSARVCSRNAALAAVLGALVVGLSMLLLMSLWRGLPPAGWARAAVLPVLLAALLLLWRQRRALDDPETRGLLAPLALLVLADVTVLSDGAWWAVVADFARVASAYLLYCLVLGIDYTRCPEEAADEFGICLDSLQILGHAHGQGLAIHERLLS